jgi:hypothetical protein
MKRAERGAGLLMAVLLVVTVAAFAVVVAASQTGSDVHSSDANADSLQALYLAETGLERALKRFATGTACGAALDEAPITDLSTIGLGTTGYAIDIGAGVTTGFGGAPDLPATQCRIEVTGTVLASNVTRTIQAIVDRNLLEGPDAPPGPDNPAFNNPTNAAAPTGWTINTAPGGAAGYANSGGPDCTRSAWLVKTGRGNNTSTAELSIPVAFTVAAGSQTVVTFHWRLGSRVPQPGGCDNGGNTGPAWPGAPCPGAGGDGQACFRFTPAAAGGGAFLQKNVSGAVSTTVNCPGGVDPGTVGPYAACNSSYQIPATSVAMTYPNKEQLTFNMAGGNITQFLLNLRLRQTGRKEIFIDHIEATNDSATGAAHVKLWRDCSSAANPVTCV